MSAEKRPGEVTLTIDGQSVTVAKGTTILQAAESIGIFIPHYCYHPGLEIVGSCRICQVQVDQQPSTTIACFTQVREGMEVVTDSDMVSRARRAVMEFLLLNHPIDCPICDTSGECELQNYYMTEGRHKSRLRTHKINRIKRRRIGQQVVLDQERCILCTRCVRFLRDITGTNELGVLGRGDHSRIDLAVGASLDGNQYAGNVIDLCPVGALTDDDFRFKCRVWYLERAASICPHCANGCNIDIHYNIDLCWKNDNQRIMRIKPRYNEHVNQYWMCDIGRYGFHFAEQESRIRRPFVAEADRHREISWEEAVRLAVERLEGTERLAFVPTPWLTLEAAWMAKKLFIDTLHAADIGFRNGDGSAGGDFFLLRNDRNPNHLGLELIGMQPSAAGVSPEQVVRRAAAGEYEVLVVVQDLPARVPPDNLLDAIADQTGFLLVLAANQSSLTERADLVLPICPWSEDHGTWANAWGRLQWLTPALPPIGYAKPALEVFAALARALNLNFGSHRPQTVFAQMADEVPVFKGITYDALKGAGVALPGYSGIRPVRPSAGEGV